MTARGWRLLSATRGACPVTAEVPARPNGRAIDKGERCTSELLAEQDQLIRQADPDVVIWWDRWSIASFLTPDGEFVRSGSPRFWEVRREGLRRRDRGNREVTA